MIQGIPNARRRSAGRSSLRFMPLTAVLVILIVPALTRAESRTDLRYIDFWRQSAGWWLATSSYFDGDMNVRLHEYHALTLVEVQRDRVVETEYKFYPPGDVSPALSDGRVPAVKGLELVTVSEHMAIGAEGSVRQVSVRPAVAGAAAMETHVVAADSGIRRVVDPDSGFESYRQYVSLNAAGKRYVLNMGLLSSPELKPAELGALRGFAISRAVRIEADQVETERARLRVLHSVGGIVSAAEDGGRQVELLESEGS